MKITAGEKIWILSIILFLIWVIIGFKLGVSTKIISVMGIYWNDPFCYNLQFFEVY